MQTWPFALFVWNVARFFNVVGSPRPIGSKFDIGIDRNIGHRAITSGLEFNNYRSIWLEVTQSNTFGLNFQSGSIARIETLLCEIVGSSGFAGIKNQPYQSNEFQNRQANFQTFFELLLGIILMGWGWFWWKGLYPHPDGVTGYILACIAGFLLLCHGCCRHTSDWLISCTKFFVRKSTSVRTRATSSCRRTFPEKSFCNSPCIHPNAREYPARRPQWPHSPRWMQIAH